MRIIDDTGRIFGRVNLIDFIVIVAIILIAINVFEGLNIKAQDKSSFEKILSVEMLANDCLFADKIRVGDCDAHFKGIIIAKKIEGNDLTLTLKLKSNKVVCNKIDNFYYGPGQMLKIGLPITFSTYDYEIGGVIIKVCE